MDAPARPMILYLVVTLLVTFDLLTGVHSQQVAQLTQHTLPDGLQSVNGSHQKGGCSRPTSGGQICLGLDEGGTSDLADCIIPSLGGFQTNWAAGLFTVNTSGQPFHIGFEFNGPVNLIRVELDLFNCPEWGIAAQSITVYEYNFGILNFDAVYARLQNLALGYTTANTTSCTSIVKVVIPLELPQIPTTSYVIYFTFDNTATNAWVHIAEVRFLEEEGTQCPTPSSTAVIPQTSQQLGPTTTSKRETEQPTPQETVGPTPSQETERPTPSLGTVQPTTSQEIVRPTLLQETVAPISSQDTIQPSMSQETVQPSPSHDTIRPSPSQETVRPTPSHGTIRPSPSQETVQPSPSHDTIRPSPSQETVRPTPSHGTIRPSLPQETVRPTLQQETVQTTLSQGTAKHTPETAPFPDSTSEPIIAAVIVTIAIILFLIMIGVVILAVVRTGRKKKQLKIESIMMESKIKMRQEDSNNPLFAGPYAYTNPFIPEDLGTLEDCQPKSVPGSVREINAPKAQQRNIPEDKEGIKPEGYRSDTIQIPPKSSELYTDLKAEEEANTDLPVYAAVVKEAPPTVSDKSEKLIEYLEVQNQPRILPDEYDHVSTQTFHNPLYPAVQVTRPQVPPELYADLKAEEEANTDLPVYAAVVKEAPPTVPGKSVDLIEYLESQRILTDEYDQVSTKTFHVPLYSAVQKTSPQTPLKSSELYADLKAEEADTDMPVYAAVVKEAPPTVPSKSLELQNQSRTLNSEYDQLSTKMLEAVYSEPIKPSFFTDATESPNSSKLSLEDLQSYTPIYTIPVAPPQHKELPLEVVTSNIREIRELGTGLFGQVVLAETVGLTPKVLGLSELDDDKNKSSFVAVKKLKPNAPKTTKETFEKEVKFMARLHNRNVIRMLGVCYGDTPFIMMEYMEKGDLNQYLKKFKVVTSTNSELQSEEDQITTTILVHMTTQIASAMKYLASHNFVHRDLATRNCLVGPNYLVKIADFGMSRSLYESHYYIIHGSVVLPVRWMSTECFYGKFSQKSDVWAFGVTMWEVFTLAKEQPYTGMSDQDFIKDAIKGKNRKLLAKPAACPPEVYEIMFKCWPHDPSERATFEELFGMLSTICSRYTVQ